MTATATPDLDFDFDIGIDLDKDRERRASERSVKGDRLPIRLGGEVVATIPVELPLGVLAPLRELDEEITLLLRMVMTAMNQGREAQERFDAASLIVDILVASPSLPTTVVDVIGKMSKALLTEEGFVRLMAQNPSTPDMGFLAKRLLAFYGLSLGESRPSLPSRTAEDTDGGETSKPTSPTTTPGSTSEASGDAPTSPASSESVAS